MPDGDRLKIFISWSGDLAKSIAIELRGLLPVVFDGVEPWVSDRDIDAGRRGLSAIARELDDTGFGIVVVTRDNQESPWINFEAGALSKRFSEDDGAHVVPLLVDMEAIAELTGPLSQFQAKLLNKDGLEDTLITIGAAIGVAEDVVKRRLRAEWEDFAEKVGKARSQTRHPSVKPKRSTESMVEETLELVRVLAQASQREPTVTEESIRISETISAALSKFGQKATRIVLEPNAIDVHLDPDPFLADKQRDELHPAVEQALRGIGVKRQLQVSIGGKTLPPF